MKNRSISRRTLLASTVAPAAAMLSKPKTALARTTKRIAANERIVVGLIGCKGMGFSDLRSMLDTPEVSCGALCDVDSREIDTRSTDLEELRPDDPPAKRYGDYRQLLEQDDLDAVIIGTPDHWHCLQAVDAMEAGKDVYLEKPIANSVAESEAIVKTAERTGRVVQVGQWAKQRPALARRDVLCAKRRARPHSPGQGVGLHGLDEAYRGRA